MKYLWLSVAMWPLLNFLRSVSYFMHGIFTAGSLFNFKLYKKIRINIYAPFLVKPRCICKDPIVLFYFLERTFSCSQKFEWIKFERTWSGLLQRLSGMLISLRSPLQYPEDHPQAYLMSLKENIMFWIKNDSDFCWIQETGNRYWEKLIFLLKKGKFNI